MSPKPEGWVLKLLLDEHVWPKLAEKLRAALPEAQIESLHGWKGGRLLHQSDERVLVEAHQAGWTLLTFDLATIPPLLAEKRELGEDHGESSLFPQSHLRKMTTGGCCSGDGAPVSDGPPKPGTIRSVLAALKSGVFTGENGGNREAMSWRKKPLSHCGIGVEPADGPLVGRAFTTALPGRAGISLAAIPPFF